MVHAELGTGRGANPFTPSHATGAPSHDTGGTHEQLAVPLHSLQRMLEADHDEKHTP